MKFPKEMMQQYQLVEEIILELGLRVYLLRNLERRPYQTTNKFQNMWTKTGINSLTN
jgi:hypothetical protein